MNFFTRRPPAANDAIFTAKSHEKIWRKNKLSFYIWRVIVPPPFLAAVYYLISINKTFLYIDRAGAVGFRSRIYVLWTKLSSARDALNNTNPMSGGPLLNFTPKVSRKNANFPQRKNETIRRVAGSPYDWLCSPKKIGWEWLRRKSG